MKTSTSTRASSAPAHEQHHHRADKQAADGRVSYSLRHGCLVKVSPYSPSTPQYHFPLLCLPHPLGAAASSAHLDALRTLSLSRLESLLCRQHQQLVPNVPPPQRLRRASSRALPRAVVLPFPFLLSSSHLKAMKFHSYLLNDLRFIIAVGRRLSGPEWRARSVRPR